MPDKDDLTGDFKVSKVESASGDEKVLTKAARDALAEAEARRRAQASQENDDKPTEFNGPSGEEPTRFGDWERKGIAYDF